MAPETVQRIEAARPEVATEALTDAIADLVAAATKLGQALHPRRADNLADLVRISGDVPRDIVQKFSPNRISRMPVARDDGASDQASHTPAPTPAVASILPQHRSHRCRRKLHSPLIQEAEFGQLCGNFA